MRAGSPLTVPPPQTLPTGPYILHPPLPNTVAPPARDLAAGGGGSSVPILLNPDIIQGTSIPIISPQVKRS